MTLVNFKLRHPDKVTPWGNPPGGTMHWFGLTDSEYWLQLKDANFYEYTRAITEHWNLQASKYVDYHAIRLIEDWTSIFHSITESIPDEFYEIARNYNSLYEFYNKSTEWLNLLADNPSIDTDTYYDKYDQIIEWIYSRTLTSMHLTFGPNITFFRNREMISIVWDASQMTEENIPVWTAQTGQQEMAFTDFINELKEFGERFFSSMQRQIEIAVEKDWGQVTIDKARLVEEHQERRKAFQGSMLTLENKSTKTTNWDLVRSLINEMNSQ